MSDGRKKPSQSASKPDLDLVVNGRRLVEIGEVTYLLPHFAEQLWYCAAGRPRQRYDTIEGLNAPRLDEYVSVIRLAGTELRSSCEQIPLDLVRCVQEAAVEARSDLQSSWLTDDHRRALLWVDRAEPEHYSDQQWREKSHELSILRHPAWKKLKSAFDSLNQALPSNLSFWLNFGCYRAQIMEGEEPIELFGDKEPVRRFQEVLFALQAALPELQNMDLDVVKGESLAVPAESLDSIRKKVSSVSREVLDRFKRRNVCGPWWKPTSPSGCALMYGVSLDTFWRHVGEGRIRVKRFTDKCVSVHADDVPTIKGSLK